MTQNLRSTQYSDKVNLTKESEYCYENDFQNEPMEYGVLYPWAVASRRSSAGADTDGVEDTPQQTPHQGICPEGWRLPSDYEWNQLEKVIAESDANVYSTQGSVTYGNLLTTGYRGNHGSKMKSNSSQNPAGDGTSLSNTDGGFNALLIGYGCGNSEFNNNAHFWSSSSVDTGKGWSRELSRNNSGVNRSDSQNKTTFYSVRCKKN
jgi:uncharacterized protein (TIGR02145 family)